MKPLCVSLGVVSILIVSSAHVSAASMPKYLLGTWTSIKGKCDDPEITTKISRGSFDQYESYCRIKRVGEHNNVTPGFYYYNVDIVCNDEGERREQTITLVHKANKNMITIGGLGKDQVVYHCKGE